MWVKTILIANGFIESHHVVLLTELRSSSSHFPRSTSDDGGGCTYVHAMPSFIPHIMYFVTISWLAYKSVLNTESRLLRLSITTDKHWLYVLHIRSKGLIRQPAIPSSSPAISTCKLGPTISTPVRLAEWQRTPRPDQRHYKESGSTSRSR